MHRSGPRHRLLQTVRHMSYPSRSAPAGSGGSGGSGGGDGRGSRGSGGMPSNGSSILSKDALPLDKAKWTTLKGIRWRDPSGKERLWEAAERVQHGDTTTSAVGIIAFLRPPKHDRAASADIGRSGENSAGKTRIVLEKQYRPPLGKMCIEVPAGMVDSGESPERTAERELKEETGYVGVARSGGYYMYNDPGFTNTNTAMVYVDVDLSRPENKDVKPELESGEFIEVFTPEVDTLADTLRSLESEGYAIDARLGAFALGLEAAKHV